jgi:hypothetical protein
MFKAKLFFIASILETWHLLNLLSIYSVLKLIAGFIIAAFAE